MLVTGNDLKKGSGASTDRTVYDHDQLGSLNHLGLGFAQIYAYKICNMGMF